MQFAGGSGIPPVVRSSPQHSLSNPPAAVSLLSLDPFFSFTDLMLPALHDFYSVTISQIVNTLKGTYSANKCFSVSLVL